MERHQRVEKKTKGTFIKQMIPYTREALASVCDVTSVKSDVMRRTPNHKTSVVMSLGSHVHHVFQIGYAHRGR